MQRKVHWATACCGVAALVGIVDVVLSFALYAFQVYPVFRLSVWMRPVLILLSSLVGRVSLYDVITSIAKSLPVLIGMGFFLLISTAISIALWGPTEVQGFGLTLSALQICLTTTNYPGLRALLLCARF